MSVGAMLLAQAAALIVLLAVAAVAAVCAPALVAGQFNRFTLNLAMFALGVIGYIEQPPTKATA